MACADSPADRSLRQGLQCSCAQLLMLRRCYLPAPARAADRDGATDQPPVARGPAPRHSRTYPTRTTSGGTHRRGPPTRPPTVAHGRAPRTPEDGTQRPAVPPARRMTQLPRSIRPAPAEAILGPAAECMRAATRTATRRGTGAALLRQHILRRADRARSGAGGARYSHLGASGTGRRDSASGNEGNMTC
jgi:hypothetical protein